MIVLVCGGRDFGWQQSDGKRQQDQVKYLLAKLDSFHAKHEITHLVQGGAKGADQLSRFWAQTRYVPFTEFPANWRLHGKAAGPIRNQAQLDYLLSWDEDMAVIAFHPDIESSKGTKDMVTRAEKAGVKTYVLKGPK